MDVKQEAADLRREFVQDVKTSDRVNGMYGVFVVVRSQAQTAFANWTYHQIIDWASENGLAVDFGKEGVLNLFDARALNREAAAFENP